MKSFKFFFILSLFSFRFFHIDAQVVYSNSYPFHLESDIQFNDTINGFSIENPNNHPVSFYLDINHLFPLDENRMLSFIEALANQKNIPLEQATWVWVRENTFFNPPYTSERWQHNPLIFLNSIGGGLCDDIASVLT
ncbi:MAG: hypothetical protein H3C71_06990, partial [Flavobacteriales bacterium]|nr:hypothetical protein [Flavobacteriales bacterium]